MSELGRLGAVILDSIFDGVVSTDARTTITHVNAAAIQLMEWEGRVPIGLALGKVFSVDRQPASNSRSARLTTGRKKTVTVEYRVTQLYDGDQTLRGCVFAGRNAAALQP